MKNPSKCAKVLMACMAGCCLMVVSWWLCRMAGMANVTATKTSSLWHADRAQAYDSPVATLIQSSYATQVTPDSKTTYETEGSLPFAYPQFETETPPHTSSALPASSTPTLQTERLAQEASIRHAHVKATSSAQEWHEKHAASHDTFALASLLTGAATLAALDGDYSQRKEPGRAPVASPIPATYYTTWGTTAKDAWLTSATRTLVNNTPSKGVTTASVWGIYPTIAQHFSPTAFTWDHRLHAYSAARGTNTSYTAPASNAFAFDWRPWPTTKNIA